MSRSSNAVRARGPRPRAFLGIVVGALVLSAPSGTVQARPTAPRADPAADAQATTVAKVERIALFVGSNAAPSDRERLKHAIDDANRLQSVFVELGAVRPANAVRLENPSASELLGTLEDLAGRTASSEGTKTDLIFYYSGHANERGLLLGDETLPMADLRRALAKFPSQLSLHLVDACRSGALTRKKGAKLGAPFAMSARPSGRGKVVITSSAEWEDSQESDRLGGSFFTVHLASGLRGAADVDDDGRVTLAEAYSYVYGRTLESTVGTVAGPQHPTFQYDVEGRGDVVLTWPGSTAGQATLTFSGQGPYLVLGADTGRVVAEVSPRTRGDGLVVRAGTYRIKRRGADGLYEGRVSVSSGDERAVDPALSRRQAYASLVRKGGPLSPGSAHAAVVEMGVRGSLGRGDPTAPMLRASYALVLPWLTVRPQVAFATSALGAGIVTPQLSYDIDELDLGLEVSRAYDVWLLTFSAGISASAVWLAQRERQEREQDRNALGFATGLSGSVWVEPVSGLMVGLTLEGVAYTFLVSNAVRAPTDDGTQQTQLTYRAFGALGWSL